jgi:hypothetical protein
VYSKGAPAADLAGKSPQIRAKTGNIKSDSGTPKSL